MGRGRAKAKQAKVARKLKYSGGATDLDALRRELVSPSDDGAYDDYGADPYAVDDSVDDSDDDGDDEDDDGGYAAQR